MLSILADAFTTLSFKIVQLFSYLGAVTQMLVNWIKPANFYRLSSDIVLVTSA